MTGAERIGVIGATASPYSRKMVGLLRYRRIPYQVQWGDPGMILDRMGVEKPRPLLYPVFLFDGKAVCDSTPIIRRLENQFAGRSLIPNDPALAFIDYLLEDFGDEWCTKYMFHYRWFYEADADNAGTLLPYGVDVSMAQEHQLAFKEAFSNRQIERLYVVGSNEKTAPVIDASYRRLLEAMEQHLTAQPFMLGARPGAGDFGLYGQLTQLVGFDPTPRQIAHDISPRTVAWVGLLEDLSGLEPAESDWNDVANVPVTLRAILAEVGRVYAPAMLANAAAYQAQEKTWATRIDGATWEQQTFPYQAKCLGWLREQYQALDSESRQRVDGILAGSGCESLVQQ